MFCCSFCGKAHVEVESLINGPAVQICNECVALCNEIIVHNRTRKYPSEDRSGLCLPPQSMLPEHRQVRAGV